MAIVGELLQGGEHSLLKSSAAAAAAAGSLLGREMTATLRAVSTLLNRGRAQDMVGASGGSDGDHKGVCKLSKKRVRDVRLFLRRLRQTVSLFCSGAVEGATSWAAGAMCPFRPRRRFRTGTRTTTHVAPHAEQV